MVKHREPTGGRVMSDAQRSILIVAHTNREETVRAAHRVIAALRASGARPVLAPEDCAELSDIDDVAVLGVDVPIEDVELAIVLGGDGTILRAAERRRSWSDCPCTTTSSSARSASTPAGAARPPTDARPRPSLEIDRPMYSSARPPPMGSTSPPASRTRAATAPSSGTIHTPSTVAWAAPARTAPESAR